MAITPFASNPFVFSLLEQGSAPKTCCFSYASPETGQGFLGKPPQDSDIYIDVYIERIYSMAANRGSVLKKMLLLKAGNQPGPMYVYMNLVGSSRGPLWR